MTIKTETVTPSRRTFLKTAGILGAGLCAGELGTSQQAAAASPFSAREPRKGPLHSYLTWSADPATTIDVNLCIREKAPEVTVYYDTVSRDGNKDAYAMKMETTYYPTPLEMYDRRAIYMAGLKDLTPGTTYYFMAGDPKYGYTREWSFRTLPGGNAPLRFVNGGDMNIGPRSQKLLRLAAQQNPDFVVIGGDLPYANGLLKEYDDWIRWFANLDEFMNSNGRMVPLVTAVGNHEVNRYESDNLYLRSPMYLSFFGRQGETTYHTHKFSDDMVMFVLDTGHLLPIEGAQTTWLDQEMAKYQGLKYKFASYHVPLYPTHRPYDGEVSQKARTYWGPLFDKYGLTIGLENHDHVFKRSKPLKGNQVVEKGQGTIYVGDGTFGVDPRTVDPEPRWYNEKEGSIAHFWVIDVKPDGLSLTAIDEDGVTVDAFTLP
ncbi:MAG: Calcineurin-like phosphoesterase [Candidatus Hydrogenedentes bacterium ADurb.Bin179]|nr:MAG: Calcineurin-like phosphoesterase [Candidatus Hydrogenedentes bacterium ADurb.Bin179]